MLLGAEPGLCSSCSLIRERLHGSQKRSTVWVSYAGAILHRVAAYIKDCQELPVRIELASLDISL